MEIARWFNAAIIFMHQLLEKFRIELSLSICWYV